MYKNYNELLKNNLSEDDKKTITNNMRKNWEDLCLACSKQRLHRFSDAKCDNYSAKTQSTRWLIDQIRKDRHLKNILETLPEIGPLNTKEQITKQIESIVLRKNQEIQNTSAVNENPGDDKISAHRGPSG